MGQPKPEEPEEAGGGNGHQLGGQSNEQLELATESEGEGDEGDEEGEDRVSTSRVCTKKEGYVLYASVGSWQMNERSRTDADRRRRVGLRNYPTARRALSVLTPNQPLLKVHDEPLSHEAILCTSKTTRFNQTLQLSVRLACKELTLVLLLLRIN